MSRSLSSFPASSACANWHFRLPAPLGTRAPLLELGHPFRQPARNAIVRHLQADDVRHLVPQRGFPAELPWRPRARRIERHDAAKAGTERADEAGQADGAHGKVVVLGKHLDENRPCRLELVQLRQRVERLPRQLHHVLAHHSGFVWMQADHEIPVADRLELVDGVEHRELVERHHVVGIRLERRLERPSRAGLVARFGADGCPNRRTRECSSTSTSSARRVKSTASSNR